jgi:hypothetical protein
LQLAGYRTKRLSVAKFLEGNYVSIVRIGLAETRHFAEGYDAIFAKRKKGSQSVAKPTKKSAPPKTAKSSAGKKKKKIAKKK